MILERRIKSKETAFPGIRSVSDVKLASIAKLYL